MPYVWFLLICAIWGSSFILMKRATVCLSPAAVSTGRVFFGAAVLAIAWWFIRQRKVVRREDWGPLAGVTLIGFAWPYTMQPWLIGKHQNSAFIGMMVAFTPLLTIAVSTVVLQTKPTFRQTVGVLGALACLSLLMWDAWKQAMPAADLALAVSVPLSYAVANNWMRKSLSHIPAVELTFFCLFGSGLMLLPLAVATPAPATAEPSSAAMSWLAVAILGTIGSGVSNFLFTRLVQQQGPLFAAMVTNIVPIGAMAWGWLDAETITSRQVFAVGGVLAMVALVQYRAAAASVAQRELVEPKAELNPVAAEA